jgi:CBS domain-containing protein
MSIEYSLIEIFTHEAARFQNQLVYKALIQYFHKSRIAARCVVMKGIEAYYENGELVTKDWIDISYNMPVKIDILLPTQALESILPTIDEMVTEGIVSVRKLSIYGHKMRKHLVPKHLRVRDIMTSSPRTVHTASSVGDVIKLLLSSIFTGVPVVDSQNHPVGMITQSDLIYKINLPVKLSILPKSDMDKLDAFLEAISLLKAEAIMSKPAISIQEDKGVSDAISLMIENDVKRLVVVNPAHQTTGILSRIDIFQALSRESPNWDEFIKNKVVLNNLQVVSDIVRKDTTYVSPDTSLEYVMNVINLNDLEAVAVIDEKGGLKGLIFEHDVLKIFHEHKVSIWEYLSSKLRFHKKGSDFQEFVETLQDKTAADVMKTELITVLEDTGIDEAIKIMITKKVKRLPVITRDGKFKGLISRESLLRSAVK